MRAALLLAFLSSCTWARIVKVSRGDVYACGWVDEAAKAGPLQCVPLEDVISRMRAQCAAPQVVEVAP